MTVQIEDFWEPRESRKRPVGLSVASRDPRNPQSAFCQCGFGSKRIPADSELPKSDFGIPERPPPGSRNPQNAFSLAKKANPQYGMTGHIEKDTNLPDRGLLGTPKSATVSFRDPAGALFGSPQSPERDPGAVRNPCAPTFGAAQGPGSDGGPPGPPVRLGNCVDGPRNPVM